MNILNKNLGKLLALIAVVPLVITFFQHFFSFGWFAEASNDGWLGFWGGFLGALISTIGVYKSVEKQMIMERAVDIENARPHLAVKEAIGDVEKAFRSGKVVYSEDRFQEGMAVSDICDELKSSGEHLLSVRNDSTKNVYNCTLFTVTSKEKDQYEIGNILPGQTVNVVFSNPKLSKEPSKIHILLDFITEKNELVIYDASYEKYLFTSSNKEVKAFDGDKMINRKEHFSIISKISM